MMPITLPRAIRRTLTFIALTAASFWLFACQARAASVSDEATQGPLFLLFITGLALLGLAYGAQVLRKCAITQRRL